MKNYVKPMVLMNEELAEGVYAASGADCYSVTGRIVQTPDQGVDYYTVQLDAIHDAADAHHSSAQVLTIEFNQPVTFVKCNGSGASLQSGDNTPTLIIQYTYHANGSENHGLGDLCVKAGNGLAVVNTELSCNYNCIQH